MAGFEKRARLYWDRGSGDFPALIILAEIEHLRDGVGDCVKRALDALAGEPVVLDEAHSGALICSRVVDEVLPC